MSAPTSKWTKTWSIVRLSGMMTPKLVTLLTGYYLLTPLNAAADGLAWLVLVNIFTSRVGLQTGHAGGVADFLSWLPASFLADSNAQLVLVSALFLIKAGLTMSLLSLEGTAQALIRRTVQEHCVASVMGGRWDFLRKGNVGQWAGAVTEEASIFANYFIMGARTLYAFITFSFLASMALLVNPRLSLLMLTVTLPAGLLLRYFYQRHAVRSSWVAQARQRFAADATERLSGLFQIKAFGDLEPHLKAAVAGQETCMRTEMSVAYLNGVINAFIPLLLPILLVTFSIWTAWQGQTFTAQLQALGSVGILGYRAVSQLSTLVGSFGNLTSFSGCVEPVLQICEIPPQPQRPFLGEPLTGIELESVGYAFNDREVLSGKTLSIKPGRIFLITGESGGGKTTLANLISGLDEPSSGKISYVGASGRRYDARAFRAKIGYVTQDVFLFRGAVRANLDPWSKLPEADLWRCLEQAGAAAFVKRIGGLDAEVAEAGRSLSGGERRRLAIACTLAQHADCLVLDEVTNGLDDAAKLALVETIAALSRSILVIAISHDHAAFDKAETTVHAMAPRRTTQETV